MTRPRGRPARGEGVTREEILSAALALLDEDGAGFGMRALAARLGVTPMSLYHHVGDRAGLLLALSERVYAAVLDDPVPAHGAAPADGMAQIRALLTRYHEAVGRHPQLTLAIFCEPAAFAGTARLITERLTLLLSALTPDYPLWRDILVDHAHGSGLALCAARGDRMQFEAMRGQYRLALDSMLARIAPGGNGSAS
ncbi:TetR/AcrR family transcriptional regulator [Massilia sp. BSC265]|uniref:TetR/AcrR family transcriptional regulator n=1 Tax=Massilia sp. BSC265 TaxID=1549812 RepID=UPI0004E88356|nr:TetR/AcrR family transcriptional regulator [Massilia sp. BSC265]KFI06924.1 TetR family transcriptional regulator [Massilia sp. BSC265]